MAQSLAALLSAPQPPASPDPRRRKAVVPSVAQRMPQHSSAFNGFNAPVPQPMSFMDRLLGPNSAERMMNPWTLAGLQMLANHGRPTSQVGMFTGVPQAFMQGYQMQQDLRSRRQKREQANQTLPYLQKHYPQAFAYYQATGDMNGAMERADFMFKQNNERVNYSLNPQMGSVDGEPVAFTVGSDGSVSALNLPKGWKPKSSFQKIDQGNQVTLLDEYGGTPQVFERDHYQPAYDGALGAAEGKTVAAMPANFRKAKVAMSSLERGTEVVGTNIDKAINQANQFIPTTGVFSLASAAPGSPMYDLAQTLETIKSNVGFDKLQEMRDASPTGGALGNVSEMEIKLLQAVRGALEQGQSREQLVENLETIRYLYGEVLNERRTAFNEEWGEYQRENKLSGGSYPGAPEPGTLIDGYIFLGGDPAKQENYVEPR